MKGMRVAEARARFGEMLDQAEQGVPVIIERRGVRFRLSAEAPAPADDAPRIFSFVSEDVLQGRWSWRPGRRGLTFTARRRKAR